MPGSDGTWSLDKGRIDADIWFWKEWHKLGKSLYLANRVPIGHLELMVRWPDLNFEPLFQLPSEFEGSGKPEGVWI